MQQRFRSPSETVIRFWLLAGRLWQVRSGHSVDYGNRRAVTSSKSSLYVPATGHRVLLSRACRRNTNVSCRASGGSGLGTAHELTSDHADDTPNESPTACLTDLLIDDGCGRKNYLTRCPYVWAAREQTRTEPLNFIPTFRSDNSAFALRYMLRIEAKSLEE